MMCLFLRSSEISEECQNKNLLSLMRGRLFYYWSARTLPKETCSSSLGGKYDRAVEKRRNYR